MLKQQKLDARRDGRAWVLANPELVKQGYRRCARCGHVGPEKDDFVRDVRCRGGFRNQCGSCLATARQQHARSNPAHVLAVTFAWRKSNPEKWRSYRVKYWKKHKVKLSAERRRRRLADYGLTPEQFDAIVEAQGGRCRICGDPPTGRWKRLHVDHDHKTGAIRGLLCVGCNRAIGYLSDSPERARRVADYLEGRLPVEIVRLEAPSQPTVVKITIGARRKN